MTMENSMHHICLRLYTKALALIRQENKIIYITIIILASFKYGDGMSKMMKIAAILTINLLCLERVEHVLKFAANMLKGKKKSNRLSPLFRKQLGEKKKHHPTLIVTLLIQELYDVLDWQGSENMLTFTSETVQHTLYMTGGQQTNPPAAQAAIYNAHEQRGNFS
ncbi:hypothetical protein ACJX0J_009894, partial [Zea mays]